MSGRAILGVGEGCVPFRDVGCSEEDATEEVATR